MNVYPSGTVVRTQAQNFRGLDGVVADPTTVTLKYRRGSGTTTTVTYPAAPIVKDSIGNYHADLDSSGFTGPDQELWLAQWTGTGQVAVIGNDSWQVEPTTL
jgi:hypothetical protein